MKKVLGILMAAFLVMGLAGPAAAAFDYGNLHLVGIEDATSDTKHDAGDGTYEYHVDLGDFNSVDTNAYGPGQSAGMVNFSQIDTNMYLGDFDATSWDDVYFGAYGVDALWYDFGSGLTETTAPAQGIAFTSPVAVSQDHLTSVSGTNIASLFSGTSTAAEGQKAMADADSYLNKNSDPETGNLNNAVNIPGESWNAELAGLGDIFLYGFAKSDKTTLEKLGTFTLSEDTDGSLLVDYQAVPVPGAVLLLGSGFLGLVGLRRRLANGR